MCKEEVIMKEKSLKTKHLGRGSPMFGWYQHVFFFRITIFGGITQFFGGITIWIELDQNGDIP